MTVKWSVLCKGKARVCERGVRVSWERRRKGKRETGKWAGRNSVRWRRRRRRELK